VTTIPSPSEVAQSSASSTFSPTQTSTPKPSSTPTISPVLQVPVISPLTGLLYRDNIGLQVVSATRQSKLLLEISDGEHASISSDGKSAIYISGEPPYWNYALVDLATKQKIELNPGKDYLFCGIEWWQSNPNYLLADVEPKELSGGMYCNSIPAIMNIKDQSLKLLGKEPGWNNFFDTSPDGQTIAFGQTGKPWLYSPNQGSRILNLQQYGFPEMENSFISHPAWSPSGRYLAWVIHGTLNGEDQQGICVFDFQNKTSRFLFPYQVEGYDGGRSWIIWAPDEQSVILDNFSLDLIWNIPIDGSQSSPIKFVPKWSPDGSMFAHLEFDRQANKAFIVISNAVSSNLHNIYLPLELYSMKWLTDPNVNWGDENILFWDSQGRNLRWSLDGESLIVELGDSHNKWNWVVDMKSLQLYRLDLPEYAEILGFLEIEQ